MKISWKHSTWTPLAPRLLDERHVRLEHPVPDLLGAHGHIALQPHLDQPALELAHSLFLQDARLLGGPAGKYSPLRAKLSRVPYL